MKRVTDILASIRYSLRHAAISDELVELIRDLVADLRLRYKEAPEEFRDEDIAFLKRVVALLPKLEQFLSLDSALQILLRRDCLIKELSSIQSAVSGLKDESFVVVSKQLAALMAEIDAVMATPNPAFQGALRDMAAQCP
jgi:hypothetical protein